MEPATLRRFEEHLRRRLRHMCGPWVERARGYEPDFAKAIGADPAGRDEQHFFDKRQFNAQVRVTKTEWAEMCEFHVGAARSHALDPR
jgi:hypothetical protein